MEITVKEFLENDFKNIIDIRKYEDYCDGIIPNAKCIDKHLLVLNPEKYLEKDKEYIIYCEMGKQSRSVCLKLRLLGYQVRHIKGGYSAYIKHIKL